jgi:hypothetical protein
VTAVLIVLLPAVLTVETAALAALLARWRRAVRRWEATLDQVQRDHVDFLVRYLTGPPQKGRRHLHPVKPPGGGEAS